jgi:hypothetical protein
LDGPMHEPRSPLCRTPTVAGLNIEIHSTD